MADSFQPDSFQPDSPEGKPVVAKYATTDSFQADSFQPDEPSGNSGQLGTGTTKPPEMLKDEDLQKVAARNQVDPNELRDLAPYYGAQLAPRSLGEAVELGAKGAAGFAGRAAFNLPQKIASKFQEPGMRKALDEVQEIGNKQRGLLETAGEIVANPIAGAGSSALARIGSAAGIGAAQGYGTSKEGEELRETARGAILGTGLGAGAELLGKVASKIRMNPSEEKLLENQATGKQFDLEQGVNEIAQRQDESEKMLKEIQLGDRTSFTPAEIDKLVKDQVGEESLARYLDPSSAEGSMIRSRIEGPVNEGTIKAQLAEDVIGTRARDFAEELTGTRPKTMEEAFKGIEEVASRQGAEATTQKYDEFLRLKQAEKYIGEAGLKAVNEPNFFGRAGSFISDAQFVVRNIDDKFGTNLEGTMRELNKAYNRSTFALRDFRNKYDQIFQEARKAGTDDLVVNTDKIYRALDSGGTAALSPAEQQTASSFQKYFEDIRNFVNGAVREKDPRIAPLSIPARENYVPHMMKSTQELVPVMEKKTAQAIDEVSKLTGKPIGDLSEIPPKEFDRMLKASPALQDLERGVRVLDNREVRNGADLSSRLKEMLYTRNGNVALESRARATLAREGEIPEFMRETNLYKLARRYTDNTLRHLYLRKGLDKLGYEARALDAAGAHIDADYVKNLVRDVLGVRKGTAAEAMLQTKLGMARKIDTLIDKYGKDSVTGGALTTAKAIPDYMQFWLRQIYPNALGYFNMRAALQNATAAVTKLAPELGGTYGYETVLKGALYTAKNFKRLTDKAHSLGSVPAEYTRKGEQAIAEGIARTSTAQKSKEAIEGAGKAGMFLYQKIEEANRALALGMGEMMAHGIANGDQAALQSLGRLPYKLRVAILENKKNEKAVGDLLGKYLNDATQYNYNKISMSEFGRTMGPFFSTFSKWPTATAGDILYETRNKGLLRSMPRNAEKYVAPFILLQLVDTAAGERPGEDNLSDRQKKFMGSSGVSQSAPIGSAKGLVTGEIFSPPLVSTIYKGVLEPMLKGQVSTDLRDLPQEAGRVATNTAAGLAQSFIPGAGLVRFLTDDLVTYVTGQKPEGSNFFEKTAEGARKLSK